MSSLYLDPKSESPIKVHKSMTIGRDFLRIAGPDYKYVSHEQFKIKEKGKDWYIEPIPGTTNSTYLNGKELTGEKRLRDGDEILIGNINTGVGLNLRVIVKGKSRKTLPHKRNAIFLNYSWIDPYKERWDWQYNMPESFVQDARSEFGYKGLGFGNMVINPPGSTEKMRDAGFRVKNMTIKVDASKVARRNLSRMKGIADSLYSKVSTSGRDKFGELSFFLSFVQAIEYKVPPNKRDDGAFTTGFLTPPEILAEEYGDCDSKSVLLATLWKNIYSEPILLASTRGHMIAGFSNIDTSKSPFPNPYYSDIEGTRFILCEPAGPNICHPGNIAKNYRFSDYQIF